MSLQDNDIPKEVHGFNNTEGINYDMQNLIDIFEQFHPKVTINREFQQELKKRLLNKKREKKIFSWQLSISLLSTACAVLIISIGTIRMIFPQNQIQAPEPMIVQTPLQRGVPIENPERDAVLYMPVSDTIQQKPISTQSRTIDTQKTEPIILSNQIDTQSDMKQVSNMNRSLNISSVVAMDSSVVQPMPTRMDSFPIDIAESGTVDEAAIVNDEIGSIVNDIYSVVYNNTTQKNTISFIDPQKISIYVKTSTFTPDEITTFSGENIHTIQLSSILTDTIEQKIMKIQGIQKLGGNIEIFYQQETIGAYSILVPIYRYTDIDNSVTNMPLIDSYNDIISSIELFYKK